MSMMEAAGLQRHFCAGRKCHAVAERAHGHDALGIDRHLVDLGHAGDLRRHGKQAVGCRPLLAMTR